MRGIIVDLTDRTINQFLLSTHYTSPTITLELEHRMTTSHIQSPWLAWILIDDGRP